MQVSSADQVEQVQKEIAPVWHTSFLIAAMLVLGFGGLAAVRLSAPPRAVPFYVSSIIFEWLLFAYVCWGIRIRKYPLSALISRGRKSWFQRDLVFGIGLWIIWYVVMALVTYGLTKAGITNTGARGTIFPHGPVQIVLWIILSVSSGFSEEIAFRGYLLQQFSGWTGSITVGIILQAILFGVGHAYLGTKQVIFIIISGAVLGIFAAWLRNIRPLLITHAWADIFGGIIEHGLPYR